MVTIRNRTLVNVKSLSHGTLSENLVIQGDNIDVLTILKEKYKNKVRCIYIDPPYNNGESYNHYNDQHHDKWLRNIHEVLVNLKPFLTKDGSIWISIDDSEMHYLKVTADEVFGRENFVTTIVWQQRTTRENRKVFSNNHEYILVYARDPKSFKATRNLLALTPEVLDRYKNPDNDDRGPWQSVSANVQAGHATSSQFYTLVSPHGIRFTPPKGRCWVYNQKRMTDEIKNNNIWFGVDGTGAPRIKKFLNGAAAGLTPETLWFGKEVGTNESAKKHILELFPGEDVFDTPKPEELIKRILEIATNEGDLVLDCYLGSGSTISVAHKLSRKYIGIESGRHAISLVAKRMKSVVCGESGGISKMVEWKGGGDFQFFKLR
jgi:adenine-specific DNA-methyltransferase